ncbi:unnamed protein product [Rhizoctonia solani]|uniref:Uncharacterized protein n=1 Tax=Rhizoctonia solani TaxID=456999 RepID=A0A8H3HS25_9AGAM|nr:unnamed protein product [Rhizoctonia solani]
MDGSLSTAIAVVVGSALLLRLSYSCLLPKPVPSIPHNPVTSLLGDIPAISQAVKDGNGLFSDFVARTVRVHGPVCQILLGWHRMVIVNDRTETERLVGGGKITDTSKRLRSIFATALPNSQISLPANETWKKHRRLSGPSMSKRYLGRMSSRTGSGANRLVELWKAKYALVGCAAFDAELDFQLATMHRVNVTLGCSIGCIKSARDALPLNFLLSTGVAHLPHSDPPPLYKAGKVMIKEIERALQSPFPVLTTWLFTYTSPTWRKYYRFMRSFFTTAITQARERELDQIGEGLSTDADCVLDMILQRERREGEESFGKDNILDELITYVFAGQDTTAVSLSWLFKYLATDADIQHRLHDEVCAVFGPDTESDEPLDFNLLDDPDRVPILESIVAETMRHAGVSAIMARDLLQDEIILGRLVPKGTQLMFTTALMSKDESEWGPDAREWRPSRWLTSDGAFNRSAGPSIPFGVGQRSCFGQRLAILQLKTYLATMSRAFFFKPVPPEVDTWEAVELVTRRPMLCYVSLERWNSDSRSRYEVA